MTGKRKIVWALVAVAVAVGFATVLAPSPAWANAIEASAVVTISVLLFAWYRADASERAYRRRWLLNFGIAGIALVALPYYFFCTRGARGGALATGGFLLSYLGLVVVSLVGSVAGILLLVLTGHPIE